MHRIFNVQRKEKQKIWFLCWLQCQESVKHLTNISYNAGKITVQCFLSVEEFTPQSLPLSDVFVPALRFEVFCGVAAV